MRTYVVCDQGERYPLARRLMVKLSGKQTLTLTSVKVFGYGKGILNQP